MEILPPNLAFALGLAVEAGAGGPVLLAVNEHGAIDGMVEASGIAEAISAIDSRAPAAARLLILLVPVAAQPTP